MIFITHDMAEAVKMGSRIAVMKAGEFVQVGTPADVVLRPADDYVRRFVADFAPQRVIKAADIMAPLSGATYSGLDSFRVVDRLAPMKEVLQRFLVDSSDLTVVGQDGKNLGRIKLESVLKVFADTANNGTRP